MRLPFKPLLVSTLLLSPFPVSAGTPVRSFCAEDINPERELIITDLAVVEYSQEAQPCVPRGRFTIEHLLAGIAPDGNPRTALLEWLHGWKSLQDLDSSGKKQALYHVGDELIKEWKAVDHPEGKPEEQWEPDFKNAPFRLLAIVNRFDLVRFDEAGQRLRRAPEVRFVFGVLAPNRTARDATVIFEYAVPAEDEVGFLAYVQEWHKLGDGSRPAEEYCEKLAILTDLLTTPAGPSARRRLAQIRTNEIGLSDLLMGPAHWNLREFRLDAQGRIVAAPTRQTPAAHHAGGDCLAEYINTQAKQIRAGRYEVPATYGSEPFLGPQATIRKNNEINWPLDWIFPENVDAAKRFRKNTCNGCHGFENKTKFVHITPREPSVPSTLSPFLRQAEPPKAWSEEVEFRRQNLADLLNGITTLEITLGKKLLVLQGLPPHSVPVPPPRFTPEQQARAGRVH